MAKSAIDQELEAIKAITAALESLDKPARIRALQYAMQHLGLSQEGGGRQMPPNGLPNRGTPEGDENSLMSAQPKLRTSVVDIRSLRNQKKPSSDIEMAALVSYYLAELAPDGSRKDCMGADDIDVYFKQAGHPLPTQSQYTLPNAKAAGYFDSAGRGLYKLNPVGHNLVAHTLPRAEGEVSLRAPKKAKTKSRNLGKGKK